MSARIRPPEARDKAQWRQLWEGYLAFYQAAVPAEVSEHTWQRIIDPAGDIRAFVGEGADGRVCALVHYLFHPSTWSLTTYCYLEDLFVHPDCRGAGIARALIEAVYRAADEKGASRVYWSTHEHNARARRLYDSLATLSGFVQYRR